jgi:hypothetical protein
LLKWTEADGDKLIGFFSKILAKPQTNLPGDTREAAGFIGEYLEAGVWIARGSVAKFCPAFH